MTAPPWTRELAGRIDLHRIDSAALQGNPLGDPASRPLWVYVGAATTTTRTGATRACT